MDSCFVQDKKRGIVEKMGKGGYKETKRFSGKEYCKDPAYGYARGYEPAGYLQRIREYRRILRNKVAALEGGEK